MWLYELVGVDHVFRNVFFFFPSASSILSVREEAKVSPNMVMFFIIVKIIVTIDE